MDRFDQVWTRAADWIVAYGPKIRQRKVFFGRLVQEEIPEWHHRLLGKLFQFCQGWLFPSGLPIRKGKCGQFIG